MQNLFIKEIINIQLFNNSPSLNINGLFNYNIEKIDLISFNTNNTQEEFEIIDKEIDEELTKKKNDMLNVLNEEKKRIIKILEYFIINVDVNNIILPFYKIYDYENISNFMKTKVRKHSNNNFFDIVKFNIKNGINKDKELILTNYSQMIMTTINKNELNEIKIAIYFILLKIIELFNIYLKSIHYSIELINENPNNTNEDYLINMDNKFFNINDDEINIYHHNIIKNSYKKKLDNNKLSITSSTIIKIKKNSNKKYEIIFD